MSTSYSPTAEFTDSATVLTDGDAANANNLNAAPKKALDRAAYLRAATDGLLVWDRRCRVAAGGVANGSFKVYVPPIEAVSLLNGTTWVAKSLSTETELTSSSHFGGGTLAANTWYHVYCELSGGNLALVVSADAPDDARIWKSTGANVSRYLFSFVTDDSGVTTGVPIPMTMQSGVYRYDISEIGAAALRVLSISSAVPTSFTNIDCSELIPSFARVGTFRTDITNGDTTNWGQVEFRKDGATTDALAIHVPPAGSAQSAHQIQQFDLGVSTSRVIEYRRISSASYADVDIDLFVIGFIG